MTDIGKSAREQARIQTKVVELFDIVKFDILTKKYRNYVILDKQAHIEFCLHSLEGLPRSVSSLNSGEPWLLFWLLHALELLDYEVSDDVKDRVIQFISACKCKNTGAFCGGPYQIPHLAPTYASICALIALDSEKALEIIDREGIRNFILSMKRQDVKGAYTMHEHGESDMRSVYCAISVAGILGILDEEIMQDVPEHIASCQSYEGGLGAEPFGEAHGGYTYCGLASLAFMNRIDAIDADRMLNWCVNRQMSAEGGFNGRSNKLVDSCYSFWIGACFPLLKTVLNIPAEISLYDPLALQAYVIIACQSVMGLYDKPGSSPDFYHTAYALGGLSHSQYDNGPFKHVFKENKVALIPNDPLLNVAKEKVARARQYFERRK